MMGMASILGCGPSASAADSITAVDLSKPDQAAGWRVVNDGVMGGVSEGKFKITDKKTLEFFGTLSLEINAVGFGLGDKKAGPFKLGIEWIKVERVRASK